MGRKLIPLLIGLLSLASCAPVDQSVGIEELTRDDPAFAQAFAKKHELDREITLAKKTLETERQAIGEKIHAFQQEYRAHRDEVQAKIRGLKAELDPARNEWRAQIDGIRTELRMKTDTLRRLLRVQRETEPLLNKGDAEISSQERAGWEDKLASTRHEMEGLQQDIIALKVKLARLHRKLSLLRQ